MIEDTEIIEMVQPNQQITANTAGEKLIRKTGGNFQPEQERTKSRTVAGGSPKGYNRKSERNKQFHVSRKEQQVSKSSKKAGLLKIPKGKNQNQQLYNESLQSLLNFHYSSPNTTHHYGYGGVKRKRTSTFNKEAFLQANCHFVVQDDASNYAVHATNPDVLVDWNNIQLVYLSTHDAPTCPICLYPPVCGKITRCGHVFCWSCIIHYLHLGEKNHRKCPICNETVHEEDLKSVRSCVQKKFARLDTITMTLMKRSKDSLFVLPAGEWKSSKIQFPVWKDSSFHFGYKLAIASPQTVVENILLREQVKLEVQLSEANLEQSGEECFIQYALEEIKKKIANTFKDSEDFDVCTEKIEGVSIYGNDRSVADMLATVDLSVEQAFSDDESIATTSSLSSPTVPSVLPTSKLVRDEKSEVTVHSEYANTTQYGRSRSSNSSDSSAGDSEHVLESMKDVDSCYFYQANDGQNIFIHPLNYRCLIEEYGSMGGGPLEITGQIIDFECFTMTKDLRKRFRYLRHLPVACEFIVCELILRPPVLSKHTIHNFMPEFKKRKEARLRKLEEQRKFDRRANAVRSRQEGYHVPSYYDEPEVNLNLADTNDFPCSISPDNGEKQMAQFAPEDHQPVGPSFAQMLKAEGSLPPVKIKSNWGQRKEPVSMATISSFERIKGESDEDVVAPSFKEMFSAAMLTTPTEVSHKSRNNKSKKTKTKNKGTLLFATGSQRKY